jgi:hypothetical protein
MAQISEEIPPKGTVVFVALLAQNPTKITLFDSEKTQPSPLHNLTIG